MPGLYTAGPGRQSGPAPHGLVLDKRTFVLVCRVHMERPPIDLFDQATYERSGPPHAQFAWLRAHEPVAWHPMPGAPGFWAITRYRDIFAVSLDPKTFSSARGGAILRAWKDGEYEPQRGMLINLDPPEHTRYRRLVSLLFSNKVIRRLEDHVRTVTNAILDRIAGDGACDFVTDVAAELPLQVIVELLGVLGDVFAAGTRPVREHAIVVRDLEAGVDRALLDGEHLVAGRCRVEADVEDCLLESGLDGALAGQ